ATASAVLRVRLTSTISRALPRAVAANAQAQPTLPVPMIPIFIDLSSRLQCRTDRPCWCSLARCSYPTSFRGRQRGALGVRRASLAEQPRLQPVEIDVDDRRRVQRQQLRDRKSADDG